MTALTLRPYQVHALDAVEKAEREGVRRPLIVHPTGTGKGVEMAAAAERRADRGRTLVLVHREELAGQFVEKLSWQAPGLKTGIVKADLNEVDADVVVASVWTAHRDSRLKELVDSDRSSPFGTILVDEAHHAPAPTWVKIMLRMGSYSSYGPLTVGFTATPERDGKTLGVWEKVVAFMSIREAIFKEYLCPILPAEVIQTDMELDKVRRTGKDFNEGDLGQALEESGAITQIADAYLRVAPERKGVAFLPTKKTSRLLADALQARGIAAEHLDGETEPAERKAILARLRTGETRCVTNCAVLTEGFDEPSIDLVIIGRPTRSHGLYVQMIGRGTRRSPGKANLLIMDVVGATERHDLISQVDLGLDIDEAKTRKEPGEGQACPLCEEPCDWPEHRCALCGRYLPAGKLRAGERRHDNCAPRKAGKVDVFGSSKLRWLPVGPAWCLGSENEVVIMAPAGPDAWRLAAYRGGRVETLHEQIPSDWAMGIGEDRIKAFQKLAERDARWLKMEPTSLQLSRLMREGLPESKLPLVRTRGDAADLLTRIQGRRAIKKMGVTLQ